MVGVDVFQGDILQFDADVLVLKYAQDFYGVDEVVARRLQNAGVSFGGKLPKENGFRLLSSSGTVACDQVLFVGVVPLRQFGYQKIRGFARKALQALAGKAPAIKHVCMTLHGAGYGLDETEAFESEIAGLVDAITNRDYPEQLERISIVERNRGRAERLQEALDNFLPSGQIGENLERHLAELGTEKSERFRSVGYSSEGKPHVFVAMPFSDEMEDTYHYGIQGAVKSAGFLCERVDSEAFTGDILDRIKERIEDAEFVVADLTAANPNVYLEVGYAWGCDVPVILTVNDTDDLKFDVQGQNCIEYDRIKDLEEKLESYLNKLGH